CQQGYNYPYSF
nr:immunoglobulin light chain junction region [Macaca mulatta]MOW40696.1 immunoglobulin light chain junction region [Macaca mulatta]MOW40723.1 immunoglobulin light chain junction region [Macaca mulatta]MOW41041.1 immunoglobulin light chain junction region [Macaca mulatta]MOW41128.1 immunoglobulin light chain junction region [Macaca mulatta]